MPGSRAHRPPPVQPWVRLGRLQGRPVQPWVRLGRLQGQGPVWPGACDPRLEARPAGGTRGPPRQAQPQARSPDRVGDPGPDLQAASLQGPDSRSGGGGGAAGPAISGKKTRSAAPAFPPLRVRGFGVAGPPAPPRLARCLFVSPGLPSSQTNGCWQELDALWGSGPRRRGGEGAPRGQSAPGAPSPGGSGGGCSDTSSREGTGCFESAFHSRLESAPEQIYKQNLRSLRRSLPRQPGGRRWRRGRGCAWQDWVYLLHLARSRGSPGTAQVPSGPSPSPRLPTPEAISVLGGGLPSPIPAPDSEQSPPVV